MTLNTHHLALDIYPLDSSRRGPVVVTQGSTSMCTTGNNIRVRLCLHTNTLQVHHGAGAEVKTKTEWVKQDERKNS